MSRVTPFLWFDDNAEQAVALYLSLFPDARTTHTARYGDTGPGKPGGVMTIAFKLGGQSFVALNGGPHYTQTPAVSFVIDCADQAEVDHYWDPLAEGGKPLQCGWLTDRFGVTWQIVPEALPRLLSDPDPGVRQRVMQAMMGMVKLDVAGLERAAAG